jgi:hypothetical protein
MLFFGLRIKVKTSAFKSKPAHLNQNNPNGFYSKNTSKIPFFVKSNTK